MVPASGGGHRGTGAGRGGSGGCRGRSRSRSRSSRRQLADVTAVADFDHKGFAFHLHGVDAGGGRFFCFCHWLRGFRLRYRLKGCRVVAVFEELQARLREQRHGEHVVDGVFGKRDALLLRSGV